MRLTVKALGIVTGILALFGCGDDDTMMMMPPEEMERVVPSDLPAVETSGFCMPKVLDEQILSVSPEGDLWIWTGEYFRVLQPDGTEEMLTLDEEIAGISYGQPRSDDSILFVGDGELWTLNGLSLEPFYLPDSLGEVLAFCGDPAARRGAFLQTTTGVYERNAGQWWRWSPASGSFGDITFIAQTDGSCTVEDGVRWLGTEDGWLWKVSAEDTRIATRDVTDAAIVEELGTVAVSRGQLLIGNDDWESIRFESGNVTTLASAGRNLWVIAGGRVYRFLDGDWDRIDLDLATAAEIVQPYAAGGVWVETAEELCHRSVTAPIRVRGFAPWSSYRDLRASFEVLDEAEAGTLSIARDDVPLTTVTATDGVFRVEDLMLGTGIAGEAGLHRLTLSAGAATRVLPYWILETGDISFADDVLPIFEGHCAGSTCHGPTPDGERVDLSTYEAWRDRATRIKERVVRGEMPPADADDVTWTPDLVIVIQDWIEGGLRP